MLLTFILRGLFVFAAVYWTRRSSAAPPQTARTALPDERLAQGDMEVDGYCQRQGTMAQNRRQGR